MQLASGTGGSTFTSGTVSCLLTMPAAHMLHKGGAARYRRRRLVTTRNKCILHVERDRVQRIPRALMQAPSNSPGRLRAEQPWPAGEHRCPTRGAAPAAAVDAAVARGASTGTPPGARTHRPHARRLAGTSTDRAAGAATEAGRLAAPRSACCAAVARVLAEARLVIQVVPEVLAHGVAVWLQLVRAPRRPVRLLRRRPPRRRTQPFHRRALRRVKRLAGRGLGGGQRPKPSA